MSEDFKVNDIDEQMWHLGFEAGYKSAMQKISAENAELRDTIKIQSEQILRLRECINRNHEDFYE